MAVQLEALRLWLVVEITANRISNLGYDFRVISTTSHTELIQVRIWKLRRRKFGA
jgi:hypothetical protein